MTITANLEIANASLVFRNFSGKEVKFNAAGLRNFCVLLDTPVAEKLKNDGWNIKWLKPRDPEDHPQAYLKIKVRFDKVPPRIVLVSGGRKTYLDASTVGILDWADIKEANVVVSPYNWETPTGSGTTAYLKSLYITIETDSFAEKYSNIPDSASTSLEDDDDDSDF